MSLKNDLIAPNGRPYQIRRAKAAINAQPQELVAVDSSGGAVVVTLHAGVDPGTCIAVGDDAGQAAVHAITVQPGIGTIDGAANFALTTANAVEEFIFDGADWFRVVSTRHVVNVLGDPIPYARKSGLGSAAAPAGTGYVHVTGGAQDAAAVLPIPGADVSPDFGAQNVLTTGFLALGALPRAASGLVRVPNANTPVVGRNAANNADLTLLDFSAANNLYVGCDSAFTVAKTVPTLAFGATTAFQFVFGGATKFYITNPGVGIYQNVNLGLYGGGAGFPDVGGGTGVFALGNAGVVPNANPAGGVVHYSELGIPKTRTPNGVILKPTCALCLAADFAVATSAAGGASNLVLPVGANEIWTVRAGGVWACSGAGGIKVAMVGPVGSTFEGAGVSFGPGNPPGVGYTITDAASYFGIFDTQAQDQYASILGRFKNGANAGTLTLSIRPVTNGQTATLRAGFWLEATPANEV